MKIKTLSAGILAMALLASCGGGTSGNGEEYGDSSVKADDGITEEYVRANCKQLLCDEILVEDVYTFPMYLKKGTSVLIDCSVSGPATVKLYNADIRSTVKTYPKAEFSDSLSVPNTAVYLLELTVKQPSYANLNIRQRVSGVDEFRAVYKFDVAQEECQAGAFRARKVPGVELVPIFEEPHKYTLRSKLKYFMDMSNSNKSVAAVKVPAGATDILYHLRISTADSEKSSDGKFFNDVYTKYKKVKFLGLPLYESTSNRNGLLRELLSGMSVQREENAYCNLYVFTNSAQAKKFQDNVDVSKLSYDMDYSAMGTQSRNERIHVKGGSTVYLGFENTRQRYDVYLWLEALATVKSDVYYTEKYTLK